MTTIVCKTSERKEVRLMATIEELETNIKKIQELLAVAQNAVQKKTFQDILNNLNQQLEGAKAENKSLEVPEQDNSNIKENTPPKVNHFFQGVGVLLGRIIRRFDDNDKYYDVVSQGKTYQLIVHSHKLLHFLKSYYSGEESYLTVYPNVTHYPQSKGKTKPPKIGFTLVAVNNTPHPEFKPNEFKFFGFWQMIPVYKGVVISIHRNKSKDLKKALEKYNDKAKYMVRANHIPILWKDAPVKPFRFNPKLEKDKQNKRYFVEIKAKFIPKQGKWIFIELLGKPTLEIPKFYKPIKAKQGENKSK